jgi:3-hydroxyacyl-[acyl-carrier-protein] dehydratase
VTRTVEAEWIAAADPPAAAAPLRAVDVWRSEWAGDHLVMTVRVGVHGDDPNLKGHFPGLAVLPGVFVIEAVCQAMALADPTGAAVPPRLRVLRSVRFLSPLLDGDELTLEITAWPRPRGWEVRAEGSRRDGTTTARIRADFDRGEVAHA